MQLISVSDIKLINKFYTERPAFASIKRNTHIFAYQISGKYTHYFGKKIMKAKEDTFIFINKNSKYCVVTEEAGLSVAFHFTAANDAAVPDAFIEGKHANDAKKLFLAAYDIWTKSGAKADYSVYAKMYEALYLSSRQSYENADLFYLPPRAKVPVYNAIEYINTHMGEKISVSHLAEMSGKSGRRFNDLFKSVTGSTPLEYINAVKLGAAKQYLETGAYSVAEISHILGFDDESYFNRLFKQKTGISPGRYRKFMTDGK